MLLAKETISPFHPLYLMIHLVSLKIVLTTWSSYHHDEASQQIGSRHYKQKSVIPPPLPFVTPPKLDPVKKVMNDRVGNAVFGREELIKNSLSGRKNTGSLNNQKNLYCTPDSQTYHM